MPTMLPVAIEKKPLAVFDVRDWYRSTFDSPVVLTGSQMQPSAIRPTELVRFFAESIPGSESLWPFSGTSELVVQKSTSGFYAFHGRVMLAGNVLANAARRLPAHAACKLTLRADGFQPHIFERFQFHRSTAPLPQQSRVMATKVELFPSQTYSFTRQSMSPTLVQGLVRDQKGLGIPDAIIRIDNPFPEGSDELQTSSVRTDANGRFLLVLDYLDLDDTENPIRILASPLRFTVHVGPLTKQVQVDFSPQARKQIPPDLLTIQRP